MAQREMNASRGNASRSGSGETSPVPKELTAGEWLNTLEQLKLNKQPFPRELLCVADFMRSQKISMIYESPQLGEFLEVVGDDADVNAQGSDGFTPLHVAVNHLNPECAELLLGRGADVDAKSKDGRTPFSYLRSIRASGPYQDKKLELHELLQYRTYANKFPNEVISLTSSKNGGLTDLEFTLEEYSETETEMCDMVKADNAEPGSSFCWIHVHSTNEINKTLSGSPMMTFFERWNESESTLAENQVLVHREPRFCQDEQVTVIVHFEENRRTLKTALELFSCRPETRFDDRDYLYGERTLDEAYYPGLPQKSLDKRNQDQVVTRHFDKEASYSQRPILMVSQVWIWQKEKTVLSAFPIRDFNYRFVADQWGGAILGSHQSFVGHVIASHVREFDDRNEFRPTLSIFESALVSTLGDVDEYMETNSQQNFDEKLERDFIHEISDIRSELVMILDVLVQQKRVLDDLLKHATQETRARLREQLPSGIHQKADTMNWERTENAAASIARSIERAKKIDKDAERIEQVIQNKLNLRRTAASINEARQAKILSLSVFGFTIITFIFTPLSFIASLLALDVDVFSHIKRRGGAPEAAGSDPEPYDGKKVIGVFIGTELIATSLTALLGYGAWQFFHAVFSDKDFNFKPTFLSDVLNSLAKGLQTTTKQDDVRKQRDTRQNSTLDAPHATLAAKSRSEPEDDDAASDNVTTTPVTAPEDGELAERRENGSSSLGGRVRGVFKRNGRNNQPDPC